MKANTKLSKHLAFKSLCTRALLVGTVSLALGFASGTYAKPYMQQGFAQSDMAEHTKDKSAKRMFAGLDLSETQKQDIAQILKQTAQDNAIFRGEKKALRQQMRDLLGKDAWDEELARDLISNRVSQSSTLQLNMAKAHNEAFNVLDSEQQASFLARQEKRAENRGKRDAHIEKLTKRLRLSDEQEAAIASITQERDSAIAPYKAEFEAHQAAAAELVFAQSFDEDAWLALEQDIQAAKIAVGIERTHAQFQILQLLSDKQKARLKKQDRKNRNK